MPLHIPSIMRKLAEIEVQRTLDFLAQNEEKYESELKRLSAVARDDDDYADFAADLKYQLDELKTLSEQMAVVALYRIVELNTIKILHWRWKKEEVETKGLYKADRLRKELKSTLSCDIRQITGYRGVDELRVANNAVKHRGIVSRELAKYPGWVVGDALKDLEPFIQRVATDIPEYLAELASHVIPPQKHGASGSAGTAGKGAV